LLYCAHGVRGKLSRACLTKNPSPRRGRPPCGGCLVYCVGGCDGPRNRPASRARMPAIENLPDCWIART